MMNVKYIALIVALLALIFISYENARFIVDDDEMVVITQFGKLVEETHKVPGEYFKIPFIQKTHYFKKYIILLEEIHEIPTLCCTNRNQQNEYFKASSLLNLSHDSFFSIGVCGNSGRNC